MNALKALALLLVVSLAVIATAQQVDATQFPPSDQTRAVQNFLDKAWTFGAAHSQPSRQEIDKFLDTVMVPRQPGEIHSPKVWANDLVRRLTIRQAKGYYKTLPNDPASFVYNDALTNTTERNQVVVWKLTFPEATTAPKTPDEDQDPHGRLVQEKWLFQLVETKDGWQVKTIDRVTTTSIIK